MNQTKAQVSFEQWLAILEEFVNRSVLESLNNQFRMWYLVGHNGGAAIRLLIDRYPNFERMDAPDIFIPEYELNKHFGLD